MLHDFFMFSIRERTVKVLSFFYVFDKEIYQKTILFFCIYNNNANVGIKHAKTKREINKYECKGV